ncbi:hypothetical protein [Kitasatospora sp. MBT66]|uniref:hypothetical protein n=1 Tax=Kitasatospora sp. MBT66 TaxID=1444769 RepID=UPI0005BC3339|nr:hypothetical protein [Kitasatospora sp. MBT66]
MKDSNDYLYTITLVDGGCEPDWWLAGIDVDSKYLKFTDWGVIITGCWTELVVKRSDDGQQYGFQVGRCILPWARIERVEDKQDSTKDFGDTLDAWADYNGFSADDIRAREQVYSESGG